MHANTCKYLHIHTKWSDLLGHLVGRMVDSWLILESDGVLFLWSCEFQPHPVPHQQIPIEKTREGLETLGFPGHFLAMVFPHFSNRVIWDDLRKLLMFPQNFCNSWQKLLRSCIFSSFSPIFPPCLVDLHQLNHLWQSDISQEHFNLSYLHIDGKTTDFP